MEVRGAAHRPRKVVQGPREVDEVLAVAPHLRNRVQDRPVAVRRQCDQARLVLPATSRAPLLELDDEVRRRSGLRVLAGQHDIDALAAQGEGMLDEHLDPAEAGAEKVLGQHRQAAVPAVQLGVRGPPAHGVAHLLGDADAQGALRGERGETSSVGAQQRQDLTPGQHERIRAVGDMSWGGSPSIPLRTTLDPSDVQADADPERPPECRGSSTTRAPAVVRRQGAMTSRSRTSTNDGRGKDAGRTRSTRSSAARGLEPVTIAP